MMIKKVKIKKNNLKGFKTKPRNFYFQDCDVVERVNIAVSVALMEHKKHNVPSIVYDRKERVIYELHSDGSRIPLLKKSREGRYSDRITIAKA